MGNIIDYIKQDRVVYVVFGISVLFLVIFGYSYLNAKSEREALLSSEVDLISEINALERDADIAQVQRQDEQNSASFEQTGFQAELITVDERVAKEFFSPAFTWDNGDDYDEIRDSYIEQLGKDNSFTKVYMQENPKVQVTEDRVANYIDKFELKMEVGNIDVIPLATEGENTISYVAFVQFYPYEGDKLVDKSVMQAGHAMIRFEMSGDIDERRISNVVAWGGIADGVEF